MKRRVYLVTIDNQSTIWFNRKYIQPTLKKRPDAKVRWMSLGLYNDGLRGAEGDLFSGYWDYPTFYAQSEPLEIKGGQQ
jgi:hypothetical protein